MYAIWRADCSWKVIFVRNWSRAPRKRAPPSLLPLPLPLVFKRTRWKLTFAALSFLTIVSTSRDALPLIPGSWKKGNHIVTVYTSVCKIHISRNKKSSCTMNARSKDLIGSCLSRYHRFSFSRISAPQLKLDPPLPHSFFFVIAILGADVNAGVKQYFEKRRFIW